MMTKPPPRTPPSEDEIERAPHLEVPPRSVRNGLLAFAIAFLWPILLGGIGWASGLLSMQAPDEFLLLFGGLSVLFLIPIAFLMPQQSELVMLLLVPVIWIGVVGLVPYLSRRRLGSRARLFLLLFLISCFSLFQALTGLFMVATKNV